MNSSESTHPTVAMAAEENGEASVPFQPKSLTAVLRWLGAITLIAAAGSYLVSSWMEASPLMRFYVFLGFTAFLAVAGTFCGLRWRDDKGARTFLAIAALFIPACVTQIAGFFYVELGLPPAPHALLEIDPIGADALLLASLACALTVLPVMFLAFAALARPEAGRLTLAYLLGNAALLLPQRAPETVALLATALGGLLWLTDRRFFARVALLKHRDGVAMRVAMFLPLLILLARHLLQFGHAPVLDGVVLLGAGGAVFLGLPGCLRSAGMQSLVRAAGFALGTLGWSVIAAWILESGELPSEAVIPVVALPIAALAIWLSAAAGGAGRAYLRLGALGAVAGLLLQLAMFGGTGSVLLSLSVAVSAIGGAFWVTDRSLLAAGLMGFVGTMLYLLFSVRAIWAENVWVSLGSLGVVILIVSSLLERNWQSLHQGTAAIRAELKNWK